MRRTVGAAKTSRSRRGPTGVAFVGVGYVADLYLATFRNWRERLALKGVFDTSPERQRAFCSHYGVGSYDKLEDMLADPDVEIVVNLTPPDQHYRVNRTALAAGKHVYSEKPLTLDLPEARCLVAQAETNGLHIVCAPSSVLGEAAQTLFTAVRDEVRGRPRLVYAEIDEGLLHRSAYRDWVSGAGAVWPAKNEFQTGCTLEHAGYAISWLVAMFGPVRRIVSSAHCLISDKGPDTPLDYCTPDFTCACLEFDGGVVARLTNSILAPHDHRFRVFCEDGSLEVAEIWDFHAPVRSIPVPNVRGLRGRAQKFLGLDGGKTLRPVHRRSIATAKQGFPMDFALGIAEMAEAIRSGKRPRLAGEFSLHITEVALAIQHPERFGTEYRPESAPEQFDRMEWLPR